jgi:hypothetical protein
MSDDTVPDIAAPCLLDGCLALRTVPYLTEPERLALANALAAMKPEWDVGEDSKRVWRKFLTDFQSHRITITTLKA